MLYLALLALRSSCPWPAPALPRRAALPVVCAALRRTDRVRAEHPLPALLAPALEALFAVSVCAARQSNAVAAGGPGPAQVTLALARLDTVAVLGVAVRPAPRHLQRRQPSQDVPSPHLAEVSYPALLALYPALLRTPVPILQLPSQPHWRNLHSRY